MEKNSSLNESHGMGEPGKRRSIRSLCVVPLVGAFLLATASTASAAPVPETDQLYARNSANQEFEATVNWQSDHAFGLSVSIYPGSSECAQVKYKVTYFPDTLEQNDSGWKNWGSQVCSAEGQALAGPVRTGRTIIGLEVRIVSVDTKKQATDSCKPGGQ